MVNIKTMLSLLGISTVDLHYALSDFEVLHGYYIAWGSDGLTVRFKYPQIESVVYVCDDATYCFGLCSSITFREISAILSSQPVLMS